jgi:hypothetical protein
MVVVPTLGRQRQEDHKFRPWSKKNPAKPLVPSYYCLYSLYNKIRDKGKIVSAGY